MHRKLVAVVLSILVSLLTGSVASARNSGAPGLAETFHRSITTIVTASVTVSSTTESRAGSAPGDCDAQTLSWTEERTVTTTTTATRTVRHRGVAHSNGALLSDETTYDVQVAESEWELVGDVTVTGTCSVPSETSDEGSAGKGWGVGGNPQDKVPPGQSKQNP